MRFLLGLLIAMFAFAASSPIHGIWNNLPAPPQKRVYGFYNYLPKEEDDRDKRNTIILLSPPGEDYLE
ncbi:Protein CBG17367 [Caenorhabditis briggsae]|uniref:Uncharacterized protein n=2 Tax=Caenorhabditis briggsae TaxID=6238 RepID=A0AAE9F7B7_CAEBR|nr:Protein CBG17367 [Caenorhabditis briggsae]ULT80931.1 hypothetical protein L3Y34_011060 [Caenorhabditis briggsae]UMM40230.1 hypothetical protein L5515_016940 [Caenorhabditis briggsae]CAP35045.1 Protein CBG17367 [Caenorhabditis briggsae]